MRSENEDEDNEMAMLLDNLPTSHTYNLNLLSSLSSTLPGSPMQTPTDLSAQMHHLVSHLEAASQAVQLWIAEQEQSDKLTTASYERHINSYAMWWDTYQASVVNVDLTQVRIPAFPVTAAKATMFLEYTSTCPKVFWFCFITLCTLLTVFHPPVQARKLGHNSRLCCQLECYQTDDLSSQIPLIPTPTHLQTHP
jgi:hypothetical protein